MAMKTVLLNDTGLDWNRAQEYFAQASVWAKNHCVSYVNYHVQDVSDVSYTWDQIAEYRFNNEKDAVMFSLKWRT